jgi:predicted nucleic acid-binding protein
MAYIFDTNIFIRSKNEMPMDIWPTFWDRFREMVNSGDVFTSVTVKEEIDKGKDELTEWLKTNAPKSFYLSLDADVMVQYADVQNWAKSNPVYSPQALNTFANVADAYLIASASAKHLTLVTYEGSSPNSKKRVMIPDACNAMGVRCCDLNTVLRELGITI